ncbi:MAG: hypothetical protein ACREAX_02320, partial [Candidatus Nitrosotenuis sp.]
MQNLALFLLLAVTASMIFAFDITVLAQETPETTSEGETTEETVEETAEETPEEASEMEDTMEEGAEETMEETSEEMETTMEEAEDVDSPLEQMTSGVEPHEIQCKTGQVLVFKASNWRPACVNESSLDILSSRGWVADHDPSHEDLAKMQDEFMAANPQEEETAEETTEEETALEEDMSIEEETAEDDTVEEETELEGDIAETIPDVGESETQETQGQNNTVKLSESMEMGAS